MRPKHSDYQFIQKRNEPNQGFTLKSATDVLETKPIIAFITKLTCLRSSRPATNHRQSKSGLQSQSIDYHWPLGRSPALTDSSLGGTAAAGRVRHERYSFCAAPEERSGSERDITGWLDDIPTSPGVLLPLRQQHKTQASTVFPSVSRETKRKQIRGGDYSPGCETALRTLLIGFERQRF